MGIFKRAYSLTKTAQLKSMAKFLLLALSVDMYEYLICGQCGDKESNLNTHICTINNHKLFNTLSRTQLGRYCIKIKDATMLIFKLN